MIQIKIPGSHELRIEICDFLGKLFHTPRPHP